MRTDNYYVYWCSSEYQSTNACGMNFSSDGDLYFGSPIKTDGWTARPFLAF